MTFILKVTCDNAAFGDAPEIELARILRHVASRGLETGHTEGRIGDHNGKHRRALVPERES